MNWYSIFYALTVSDGVKSFFDVSSNIFSWFAVLSFLALIGVSIAKSIMVSENMLKNEEEEKVDPDTRSLVTARVYAKSPTRTTAGNGIKGIRNFFYLMLGLALVTWTGWVLTPTKKDCVMIIAGGGIATFLTSDTCARKIPSELMKLGVVSIQSWQDQIKDMKPEEKVALGIQTPEEKAVAKKKDDLVSKVGKMTKEEIVNWLKSDTTILK